MTKKDLKIPDITRGMTYPAELIRLVLPVMVYLIYNSGHTVWGIITGVITVAGYLASAELHVQQNKLLTELLQLLGMQDKLIVKLHDTMKSSQDKVQ